MSHATLYVRFPDGSVRFGIYSGTSDIASPRLFAHPRLAWDAWNAHLSFWPENLPVDGMPVQVCTDYGGGMWWDGRGTYEWFLGPFDFSAVDPWFDERPDWAVWPEDKR